ncbi:hypothetical protein [Amycolatopsis albidoflavus]|uniref:Uncharacterized protein n=1 Tax=Amycolatopsis albidoflavus TaxID=102226 RepID=A0ABW5I6C7_9PSEU
MGPVEATEQIWQGTAPAAVLNEIVRPNAVINDELRALDSGTARLVTPEDDDWPIVRLTGLASHGAPLALWVRGNGSPPASPGLLRPEEPMKDHDAHEQGLTPAQRILRARIAANASWARTPDRTRRTAPARKAALDRFEKLVDPAGELNHDDRTKRAEHARKEHFQRLALLSSRARRRGIPSNPRSQ